MPSLNWIQTYNGHRVWPFNASAPENVFCIEDIAHSLANTCRFGGHVKKFYSVAEHCVLGSRIIGERHALQFLMHDAAEAYLHDITRPVKQALLVGDDEDSQLMLPFKRYEDALQNKIFEQLGLILPNMYVLKAVKDLDDAMLVREAQELFKTGQRGEWVMHPDNGWRVADTRPLCWESEIAERKFLERWAELTSLVPAVA